MNPLVYGLLIMAAILFVLGLIPPLAGGRFQLWVASALSAIGAILLYLFVFKGGG